MLNKHTPLFRRLRKHFLPISSGIILIWGGYQLKAPLTEQFFKKLENYNTAIDLYNSLASLGANEDPSFQKSIISQLQILTDMAKTLESPSSETLRREDENYAKLISLCQQINSKRPSPPKAAENDPFANLRRMEAYADFWETFYNSPLRELLKETLGETEGNLVRDEGLKKEASQVKAALALATLSTTNSKKRKFPANEKNF